MSVTLVEDTTPSIGDARRAAEALLAEGAEEVFLYGSVAHGKATAHSDIDLVALFADIDYAERYELTCRLEKAASEAILRRWLVQVFVTDRPEWKARVERVPSSFESRINARGLIPVGESAIRGEVRWSKTMERPMSDPEEALRYFQTKVIPELEDLQSAVVPIKQELDQTKTYEKQQRVRLSRMARVCAKAALVVEKTFKGLAVLHTDPTPDEAVLREAGHDIEACLNVLPPGLRIEFEDRLKELGIALWTISSWRVWATYPDNSPVQGQLADQLAADYVTVTIEFSGMFNADLRSSLDPGHQELQDATERWQDAIQEIASQYVRPHQTRRLDLDL